MRAVLYFCKCFLSFKNKIKQNYSLTSTFTFSFRKCLCLPPSNHSFGKYLLSIFYTLAAVSKMEVVSVLMQLKVQ